MFTRKSNRWCLGSLIACLGALVACGGDHSVKLGGQVPAGQGGSASISEGSDTMTVDLTIKPGPRGAHQAAQIRLGRCAALGAVEDGLEDVVDGKSTTLVNHRFRDLRGTATIVVYSSTTDFTVVSCGDIN